MLLKYAISVDFNGILHDINHFNDQISWDSCFFNDKCHIFLHITLLTTRRSQIGTFIIL